MMSFSQASRRRSVKRQSLKVQINTTGDTICMKYLRPNPNTKLEGFIVGYGSSFYSNQYIPLPTDGKSYMTEVDAEPRYLIVVRPARTSNKKTCSGQTKMSKPLQLVVGTLTPSSVFLSWGILVNPHHDWTAMSNCASDRFYTVRYREKDKNKKWAFQLCPATETVVENLKPNTLYEFGVKDNTEDGIWSKSFNHKTVLSSKSISGQLQNTYKVVPNGQTQLTLRDPKNLVPVTIIKQVIQNITQRTSPKTTDRDRSSLPILVHLIIPGLNESLKKLPPALSIDDISQTIEKKFSKNETQLWPAESKTPEVQELSPQSLPGTSEPLQESIMPTVPGALEKSEASLAHSERASRLEETKSTSKPELAHTPTTLATSKLPELPKTKTSPPLRKPAGTLVTSKLPELPKTKTSPPLLKPTGTLVTSKLPEFPKTKTSPPLLKPTGSLAPNETSLVPSKLKPSATPEVQHVKPAPRETKFIPSTTKPTARPKMPRTRPASYEPQHTPSKSKASTSAVPEMTYSEPESSETQFIPLTAKSSVEPKMPQSKAAPKETQHVPSRPKPTPKTHIPQTKPVLDRITLRTERPKTAIAPKETRRVPSKPKATQSPEMLSTKPVLEPITFRTEKPKATLAPKDARRVYSKPSKTVPSPGVPPTKAGPKETRRVPLKPKTTSSPDVPQAKTAPKETRLVPSKPKTSLRPEGPQTKAVPNETTQTSFNPKTARTPENPLLKTAPRKVQLPSGRAKASDKPHSRPALSRTTPGPGRTKTPGVLRWDRPTTDGLTEEDIVKFTGKDLGISWESSVSKKRPISEMLPPDPQHPPLAPAKPTQVRRKPLPPSTVTGKPGSPVNVLVPQVPPSPMTTMTRYAKPTNSVKTGAPRKSPTASATPEDFVGATVFSSSPTSETDSLGKPRYTAPHVKYMKKEEDVPCSITSSLEYFPQEEGGSKEEPAHPPQNPPTNLTVVTVEGCPSFVILDWEKPDNDTVTEYEVVSTENGAPTGKNQSIITTNQTHSAVENLKPDTSYEFQVKPRNPLGEGPSSNTVAFNTESADPRVSEPISMGKDAIWTQIPFESDSYSECKGKQYVKRTWYKKFVGVQLCNSLRYKIYLSDSLTGKFYNIGDQRGHGEDHCQFVDSFLDGRTGQQVPPEQLPAKSGFFRAVRQEPVKFGKIGGETHINYVHWYECGTSIPGKW